MGNKYTASQFIKAIPGTGGIITAIAERIGCNWYTVRRYIDRHPTVKTAWEAERHKITDKARHNIIKAISEPPGDLATSKWWVTVMDDDFRPPQRIEATGKDGGPIETKDASGVTDEERVARIAALLDEARARGTG